MEKELLMREWANYLFGTPDAVDKLILAEDGVHFLGGPGALPSGGTGVALVIDLEDGRKVLAPLAFDDLVAATVMIGEQTGEVSTFDPGQN